jgi:hypothetical protein
VTTPWTLHRYRAFLSLGLAALNLRPQEILSCCPSQSQPSANCPAHSSATRKAKTSEGEGALCQVILNLLFSPDFVVSIFLDYFGL